MKHPRRTMVIGTCASALTMLSFDLRWLGITGFWHISIMCFIVGIFLPPCILSTFQEISNTTLHELKLPMTIATNGLVSTCWNLGYSLGNIIGPAATGYVASKLGFYPAMWIYGGSMLFLGLITSLYFSFKSCKNK